MQKACRSRFCHAVYSKPSTFVLEFYTCLPATCTLPLLATRIWFFGSTKIPIIENVMILQTGNGSKFLSGNVQRIKSLVPTVKLNGSILPVVFLYFSKLTTIVNALLCCDSYLYPNTVCGVERLKWFPDRCTRTVRLSLLLLLHMFLKLRDFYS